MRVCIKGPRSSAAMISASTGGLPRFKILFVLRKLHDVVRVIAQSHELAPTRWQDRIIERTSPDGSRLETCDQLSAFRDVLNVQFAFSSAGAGAAIWADCSAFLSCSRSRFNSEI